MQKILFSLSMFFFLTLTLTMQVSSSTLYAPISPSPALPLFFLTINSGENYFIQINAPLLVRRCSGPSSTVVPCSSATCYISRLFNPAPCALPNNTILSGRCACAGLAFDPFSATCGSNQLTRENILVPSTNPRKPKSLISQVTVLCVPIVFRPSLPAGIFGVAGLSRSPISAASQLASPAKKYALCLPSSGDTNNRGVIFFGDGPYRLKRPANLDVSRILSETPLILNKNDLNGNYITLRGISVNGKDYRFSSTGLGFGSTSSGDTLLSTTTQYTTVRSDIYKFLLDEFSNATSGIPRAELVQPFGLCLQARSIGSGRTGLNVPRIDLMLHNGRIWTVFGSNSMRKVSDDVACLAFVDGGASPGQAVVIGSYQMENRLLVFDFARSVLGFSSALSLVNASCSDFQTGS